MSRPTQDDWLTFALLEAFFAPVFVYGLHMFLRARAARKWPCIAGKILSSRLKRVGLLRVRFWPEITYEYELDGTRYVSSAVTIGNFVLGDKSSAAAMVEANPPHAKVNVYYNPKKPRDSILVQGALLAPTLAMLMGAACCTLFVLLLLLH